MGIRSGGTSLYALLRDVGLFGCCGAFGLIFLRDLWTQELLLVVIWFGCLTNSTVVKVFRLCIETSLLSWLLFILRLFLLFMCLFMC